MVAAIPEVASVGSDVFSAGGAGSASEGLAARNTASSKGTAERRKSVLATGNRKDRGKRGKGASLDSLAGKTNGGPLLAEYLGGTLIIVLGTFTQGGSKGYATVMSQLILRMTALTTVFFVLFLLSGTKGGKAAVWFGLLVDLGILFTAASQGATAQLADIVSGVPTGGNALTTSDITEPPPPVILPSDQPAVTVTA